MTAAFQTTPMAPVAAVAPGGDPAPWIVCQLGARENYAIARALAQRGALAALVTDAWVPPRSMLGRRGGRLGDRFHPALADVPVAAPTLAAAAFELGATLRRQGGWSRIMARNAWFGRMAARRALRFATPGTRGTVFAYSYAAREIFARLRARGWRTVLGQIDPGPAEARLVDGLHAATPAAGYRPIPAAYWDLWRQEVALSDLVVVNSRWSAEGLIAEGVPQRKIRIVPLAYEGPDARPLRTIPARFTPERPLRTLFLGQIGLRKGVAALFDAIALLPGAPVEFRFVGDVQVNVPPAVSADPRVRFLGPARRGEVHAHYASADLFLFPTLSDGFGLTQLEALAAGLPVIASRRCGDVVRHDVNGLVIDPPDGPAIAAALRAVLDAPERLAGWAANAAMPERHSLSALGDALLGLAEAGPA